MSVNLTVGLATPPMGLVLFVASSVSGEKIESISKSILPFLAVEVVVIFMITYIPAVSLAIPILRANRGNLRLQQLDIFSLIPSNSNTLYMNLHEM